ncbi:MAG: VOC family protein, partial [Mycobacteriales bacterium]
IIIFCTDVEASAKFYEGALGLQRRPDEGDVTLRLPTKGTSDGAWLLLHQATEGGPQPHPLGYFAVDDVDVTVERLRSAGYRIRSEPTDQPWGIREAGVVDPDGYDLMLSAPQPSDS